MNAAALLARSRIGAALCLSLAAGARIAAQGEPDLPSWKPPAYVFEFDANGALDHIVDELGNRTRFEHDLQGRLTAIRSAERELRFGYDREGRKAWARDDLGSTHYRYDGLGRLKEIRYETPQVHRARYEWGAGGELRRVALHGASDAPLYAVSFERDAQGRLRTVQAGPDLVRFEHRASERVILRSLPDGTRSRLSYAPTGEIQSIAHFASDGTSLGETSCSLDPVEQSLRLKISRPQGLEFESLTAVPKPQMLGADRAIQSSGDGLIHASAASANKLLGVPLGADSTLYAELDGQGSYSAAILAAPWIPLEHSAAGATTFHLERYMQSPSFIAERRLRMPRPEPALQPEHRVVSSFSLSDELKLPRAISSLAKSTLELAASEADSPLWKGRFRTWSGNASQFSRAAAFASDLHDFARDPTALSSNPLRALGLSRTVEGLAAKALDKSWEQGVTRAAQKLFPAKPSYYRSIWGDALTNRGFWGLVGDGKVYSPRQYAQGLKGVGGEAVGLGFDLLRGKRLDDPELWEHVLDGIAGGAAGIATRNERVAAVVADIPDVLRPLVAPLFKTDAIRRAERSPRVAGDWIWQTASGSLHGGAERTQAILASKLSDKAGGPLAFGRGASFRTYQEAVERGDTATMSRMLLSDRHLGAALTAAGYSSESVQSMGALLAAGRRSQLPPQQPAQAEHRLGGIELRAEASFGGKLGRVTGAVYEAATQRLILVGDGETRLPALDAELLAAALLCAYAPQPVDPAFSLDPHEPANPGGPWQSAVYLPQQLLRGTTFGDALYRADLALKQYALGVRMVYDNWVTAPSADARPRDPTEVWGSGNACRFRLEACDRRSLGVRSLADHGWELPLAAGEQWSRQFIVSREVELLESGSSFVFGTVRMGIEPRRQERGPNGTLRDVAAEHPTAKRFAEELERNFDAVAEFEPALQRVKELAKAVALAKWLRKQNAPVDLEWARRIAAPTRDPVERISTLEFEHHHSDGVHAVRVFGGVDLRVRPEYRAGSERAAALGTDVASRLGAEHEFELGASGDYRQAAVLALTDAGRKHQRRQSRYSAEDVDYELDADGRIERATDAAGNEQRFTWDAAGHLVDVRSRAPSGWESRWHVGDGSNRVIAHGPDGESVAVSLAPNGEPSGFEVDGQSLLRVAVGAAPGEVELTEFDGDAALTSTYDARNRLVRISRAPDVSAPAERGAAASEVLTFAYGERGVAVRQGREEVASLLTDAALVRAWSDDTGTWQCGYDERRRLTRLDGPGPTSLELDYEGERLSTARVRLKSEELVCEYGPSGPRAIREGSEPVARLEYSAEGRLYELIGADGSSTRFSYSGDGTLRSMQREHGYRASFDRIENGRLRVVIMPEQATGQSSEASAPESRAAER